MLVSNTKVIRHKESPGATALQALNVSLSGNGLGASLRVQHSMKESHPRGSLRSLLFP